MAITTTQKIKEIITFLYHGVLILSSNADLRKEMKFRIYVPFCRPQSEDTSLVERNFCYLLNLNDYRITE